MKKVIIIFCILFSIFSCIRKYEVNFIVGNNGYIKDKKLVEETEETDKQVIYLPPGSANLTIYIQAEVPKNIDANANVDASLPLIGQ